MHGVLRQRLVIFCVTMTTFLINKATLMVSLEDIDSLEDYH